MVSLETARLVVICLFLFAAATVWYLPTQILEQGCDCLIISFLDVGQGDAIYIKTPDNFEMLVDGGKDSSILGQLAKDRPFFDRSIDLVVATHPDLDHIGGLIDVLRRYEVVNLLLTTNQNDTPAAAAFSAAVAAEKAAITYAESGQRFLLGASTTITIYSPRGDESSWDSNNASIVMKVSYGETDILLTGDAPAGTEQYLVGAFGADLESEILKLGHHGSRTSTSELFLDTVSPDYAIISAAVDNRYNHPHQEVMARVFERDIPTYHTGVEGTVTFYSDGKKITAP